MKRLSFVIWMIGWPLACAVASSLSKEPPSEDAVFVCAMFELVIWLLIAVTLWEDEPTVPKLSEKGERE